MVLLSPIQAAPCHKKKEMRTGETLLSIMCEHGVSKRELSRITNVSLPTISRLINGNLNGNLYTWVSICQALNIPIDEVLRTTKIELMPNSERTGENE